MIWQRGPFRKVVKKGQANFWRGNVKSYSDTLLECGHLVSARPTKTGCPSKVRCGECGAQEKGVSK